jgi:BolA protein
MSRAARIELKLKEGLPCSYLQIENESHKHSVPKGAESHFKVLVVSNQFEEQSQIQRQREIYTLLSEELKSGLHALSLRCLSDTEYQKNKDSSFVSPQCASKS